MVFRPTQDPLAALRGMTLEECSKDGIVTIPLTLGYSTIVDEADAHLVLGSLWHAIVKRGGRAVYAVTGCRSRRKKMQNVIAGPVGNQIVDHKNHRTLDNRRKNLRKCTWQQNAANKFSPPAPSGFRGVHKLKSNGRFTAHIRHFMSQRHLGTFDTAELAAAAYDRAAVEAFGEFAILNFPNTRVDT